MCLAGFSHSSIGKESACNAGGPSSIPGLEDPLEKEMATHPCTLAWKILWMEEPGGLRSMEEESATNHHVPQLKTDSRPKILLPVIHERNFS